MTLTPLPADYRPDFSRWRTAVLRQGEPDWVPWQDGISEIHKQRILGHPGRGVGDDIPFRRHDRLRLHHPHQRADGQRRDDRRHDGARPMIAA